MGNTEGQILEKRGQEMTREGNEKETTEERANGETVLSWRHSATRQKTRTVRQSSKRKAKSSDMDARREVGCTSRKKPWLALKMAAKS